VLAALRAAFLAMAIMAVPAPVASDTPSTSSAVVEAFAPDAPLFGPQRRAQLANSVLHFVPGEGESRVEDGVFTLPVPLPWPPGAASRNWEGAVPAGLPVFLLAAVMPNGESLGKLPAVQLNGVPVAHIKMYAVPGVRLSDGKGLQDHTALALVLPPPAPGRHVVQVTCAGCAPVRGPWLSHVNAKERTYVLDVRSDATPAPPLRVMAGSVLERRVFSQALGRELPYRIYLPAGYEPPPLPLPTPPPSDGALMVDPSVAQPLQPLPPLQPASPPLRRYPVVYLLHGLGGGMAQWSRLGLEAELDRTGAQFIAVMPAGRAGYWANHADGGPRWADYVAHDVVSHVDATYRTIATREARAIGGISMGGHGALQVALNHPTLFGVIGAHSPALRLREHAPVFLGGAHMSMPPGQPGGPVTEAYATRDPISLVARSTMAHPPRVWVDTGELDGWFGRAVELRAALRAKGWRYEWVPAPGGHDAEYWQRRMPEYARWYGDQLLPPVVVNFP